MYAMPDDDMFKFESHERTNHSYLFAKRVAKKIVYRGRKGNVKNINIRTKASYNVACVWFGFRKIGLKYCMREWSSLLICMLNIGEKGDERFCFNLSQSDRFYSCKLLERSYKI